MGKKPLPDGQTVGSELLDVILRFNRWVTYHAEWALPPSQARLLSQIDELGSARIGDLARGEHCSQPTMTTQVRRLESEGLLKRVDDPDDARAVQISLTEEGKRVLCNVRRARATTVKPLLDQLDCTGQKRVQDAVATLTDLLNAAYDESDDEEESEKS